jgi:hypothetical protein
MDLAWVPQVLIASAAAALITWAYARRSGRPRMLERAFAAAMLLA